METQFDRLFWTPDYDFGDGRPEELRRVISEAQSPQLSSEDIDRMVRILNFRAMPSVEGLARMAAQFGLVSEDNEEFELAKKNPIPIINKLSEIAEGHEALLYQTKPVNISASSDINLRINYGSTRWEGVGGIGFYVENDLGEIPLYVMRGNPIPTQNSFRYDIRAIQPWLSEQYFLYGFHKEIWTVIQEDWGVSTENIQKAREVFEIRQRTIDRLNRIVNSSTNIYGDKTPILTPEIFLLLGVAYLQGSGVSTVRGIEHECHPEAVNLEGVINYNELFAKQFESDRDGSSQYPWKIDNQSHGCVIPNFNHLPPTMKQMLMETYEATYIE